MNEYSGRSRTGSLFRRWRGGRYNVDDPRAKGRGTIYLKYMLGGKLCVTSLKTASVEEARKMQRKIMRPLELADQAEALAQIELRHKQALHAKAEELKAIRPPLSVDGAWASFSASQERPDTGQDTLKYYAGYWDRFKVWLKTAGREVKSLCDITPEMAQKYAADLLRTGISPNTFNKNIGFLKLFFRVLFDSAGMKENPFDKIRKKKLKTSSRRELTIAEVKTVLEKADGDLQVLLYLGMFTGLRLGDCCTLRWNEVDLDRGVIRRIPNKTAKSGKPVLIGIPRVLHEKLSQAPASRRRGYVLPRFAELYTCRNETGRPVKQPDIANEIQAHFKACGLQTVKSGTGKGTGRRAVIEVGFHSLRHTYVSLHAEAGTPQAMIQAHVGHSNPAMTSHYTHISEEAAVKAAKALDRTPEGAATQVEEGISRAIKLIRRIKGRENADLKRRALEALDGI